MGFIRTTINRQTDEGNAFPFEEHDTFLFGRLEDCHCCLPSADGLVARSSMSA